jgi:hypothetical protein
MLPSELKHFFKLLAINHPQILHEDVDGKRAFAIDKQTEILDGVFRQGLKSQGFNFRYASPQYRTVSDETRGIMTQVEMAYAILKRVNNIQSDIDTAIDETFKIVQECNARIVFESRRRNPIFGGSLNHLSEGDFTIEETLFQGDGSYAGHLNLFSFKTEYIEDIEQLVEETGWLDL